MSRTAVVTGASSGIGAATARALAGDGFHVVCAARRKDRIEELAEEIGGTAVVCDVTDDESVACAGRQRCESVDVLVNNAGGAVDAATVEEADVEDWARMFDLNALSMVRVTQALLPALRKSGGRPRGQHGLDRRPGRLRGRRRLHRGEARGEGAHGDAAARAGRRAAPVHRDRPRDGEDRRVRAEPLRRRRGEGRGVYEGVAEPLVAEDIAEMVRWVASLPSHVNIDELVCRPRAQAAQHKVHREK